MNSSTSMDEIKQKISGTEVCFEMIKVEPSYIMDEDNNKDIDEYELDYENNLTRRETNSENYNEIYKNDYVSEIIEKKDTYEIQQKTKMDFVYVKIEEAAHEWADFELEETEPDPLAIYSDIEVFQCADQQLQYTTKKEFSNTSQEPGEQFPCAKCGKIYCTNEEHHEHKITCLQSGPKNHTETKSCILFIGDNPYKCLKCDYSAAQVNDLRKHLPVHTRGKRYKCNKCDYSSSRECDFNGHMNIHTKPRRCTECDFSAANYSILKDHVMKVHIGAKCYKCSFCKYSTSQQIDLIKHESIHSEDRKFKCAGCDLSFIQITDLRKHLIVHSEKIYKCDICSYTTVQKASLTKHKKLHLEDRKFNCTRCGLSFIELSDLRRHLSLHSEKIYKCDICSYTTVQRASLTKHKRIHSEENCYKCVHCDYYSVRSDIFRKHLKCKQHVKNFKKLGDYNDIISQSDHFKQ